MRRRPGADVVLAVLLPAACALALLLLHPDRSEPGGGAPVETPLTSASVVCPSALAGSGADTLGVTVVGADPDATLEGDVQAGLGAESVPLPVRGRRVSLAQTGAGPTVVTGAGELAPGLVAGRSQSAPLAAVDCAPPVAGQWFTGVGADATHDSVLELVNPNAGRAIADVTVRSPGGVLEVPALRGVSVPGHSSVRLDLGTVVPNRAELALEVHTSRGRLAVHVVDTYDQLGSGAAGQDWLPAQAEPATESLLLGLSKGAGGRTLVLANPGADEVRATLSVVTPTSTYAPTGVEDVRVAPDSTEAVSLDDVLAQAAKDDAIGLLVESNGPVTSTLRQIAHDDLSLLTTAPVVDALTAAVLPTGPKHVLLAGASGTGTATVTAYSARGKQLDQQEVGLAPDAGADVTLPDKAVLVTVTPTGTTVRAAVRLDGAGTAVVPLRELVLTGLVPDVRPGAP
jgi:hypothetical protein